MSLKQVRFSYFGDRLGGTVVYLMEKGMCTFSAVTQTPSSLNAAEDIVKAICRAEHCRPTDLRFFDLQTYQGYSSKKPGEYELDELKFKVNGGEITNVSWDPCWCPVEVHEAFSLHIHGLA